MGEVPSLEATLGTFGRAPFAAIDILRRALGNAVGAFGLDPDECPYRIVGFGPHWRLRDYGGHDRSLSLLVVVTPIKRAYIWDLAPFVSAVRYCIRAGLHVHLLEWMPASQQNNGLDEYAEAISECVAKISSRTSGTTPFLVGHSLGGTLAAIFTAWATASIRGLILLGAPLCFEPATSRFRDALVSLIPPAMSDGDPFPGSLLSFVATLASPGTFIWSRVIDTASSITDRQTLEINARIERWALDEVPLPGKLVHQIVQWLYRENRLCRGTLKVSDILVGPSSLSVPALAIVTTADEVAPLASVKPFIDAMPATGVRIIQYPGEVGLGCSISEYWSGARHAYTSGQKSSPGSRPIAKGTYGSGPSVRYLAMSANGTEQTCDRGRRWSAQQRIADRPASGTKQTWPRRACPAIGAHRTSRIDDLSGAR